jgi:hypothetical protein
VTGRVRRWYRIAAAATVVVAAAALALGASGQLLAPDVAPNTTKAVLARDTATQNPGTQAVAGAGDDPPCRLARGRRTSRRAGTRSWAPCRSARSGHPTARGTPPPGTGHARPVSG